MIGLVPSGDEISRHPGNSGARLTPKTSAILTSCCGGAIYGLGAGIIGGLSDPLIKVRGKATRRGRDCGHTPSRSSVGHVATCSFSFGTSSHAHSARTMLTRSPLSWLSLASISAAPVQDRFFADESKETQSLMSGVLTACILLGAFVGCFIGVDFGNRFGRRVSFRITGAICVTMSVLLALVPSFALIVIVRTALGLAVGLATALCPWSEAYTDAGRVCEPCEPFVVNGLRPAHGALLLSSLLPPLSTSQGT